MSFKDGNKADGKHYWLTPDQLLEDIYAEFEINFDPCPHPKPDDFDGLTAEWGSSNYVNPPFGAYVDKDGKKKGPTAWVRKAIAEYKKGKKVVLVYPIDKWILMLLEQNPEVRNLRDVKWLSIEDHDPGKGTGRHIAMFILDPEMEEISALDNLENKFEKGTLTAIELSIWWVADEELQKNALEELADLRTRIAELEAELKKAYLVEWHKGYEEGLKDGYSNG